MFDNCRTLSPATQLEVSMHRVSLAIASTFTVFVTVATSTNVGATLTPNEILCQKAIGHETARYSQRVHIENVHCNNDQVHGRPCDAATRDATIARARAALNRTLLLQCSGGGIALEHLGFPGSCPDPDGGVFSATNLVSCIVAAVQSQTDMALMVEYPDLRTLSDGGAHCQSTIGAEGRVFMSRKQRARDRCLNHQLRNPSNVDCRAEVPPGTGDASTDHDIMQAANRLADKLQRSCSGVTLEALGFPGSCLDPDGGSFSLENLQACIHDTHEAKVDALVAIIYPVAGAATPTPTSTATPPGATESATPTAVPTVTPTATPTAEPSETSTPTETATPVETATPTETATPGETATP